MNLYVALGLSPKASSAQILTALHKQSLDTALQEAVHTWLLNPAVRAEYDARLRQAEPSFFETQATFETHQDSIELYHPDYAGLLGLVFLPSACYLHALNWRTLGNLKKSKQNQFIALAFLVFMTAVVLLAVRLGIQIPIAIGLIWVFVWYYGLGKEQVAFIQHELGDNYTPKGWYEPILLTIIAMSLYGVFLFALLALLELLGVL